MDNTELSQHCYAMGYSDGEVYAFYDGYEKGREDVIDEELQNFAQWLWDNYYLVSEALTIRLVDQYKEEQLKEKKND